jgi:F0F1-type ATP synthase assembly protein I
MAWYNLFTEAPDVLSKTIDSFSGLIPILIIILLLIGILYWLRSLRRASHTEIRVYRRP